MAEQAPAVFNVVCCGGVWKSQMSMQKQRAYSQSATGGTGKNRIRVCFGLFCCMCDSSKRYLGVYPEDSSLFLCGFFYWEMFLLLFPCENKVMCSVCSQDVIWGFQPLWVFVVWSLKDFIFLRGVCVLREEASFKYWIHFKNVCSWDDSNIGTLRTRQLGHKVMNSQDCWQVCSRGVSRLVKKRLAWGTLRKLLKPNKISSVSCICTHQLLP